MKKIIFKSALFFVLIVTLLLSSISPVFAVILGTTGDRPEGITIDTSGNVYTANSFDDNVSKITPGGVSSILGTTGSAPFAITIDSSGNIYTANAGSGNVSKITPGGVSTILGTTGTSPYSITIDGDGNIYTANSDDDNVSKITPGGVSTILGTTGSSPRAITIDTDGNIYTANYFSGDVSKITPGGVSTILGTTGSSPHSITVDTDGNVYTGNTNSDNVSKITPGGVSTILGTTGTNPRAITVDGDGNIYTANLLNDNVSKITPVGVSTIVGTTGTNPRAITLDVDGNIYTANYGSDNVSKINNPVNDATVTSETYTVSTEGDGTETIRNIPLETSKADFLDEIAEGSSGQTWDDTDISDPVETGDTLVVTAENGVTVITYTLTVGGSDLYWYNDGVDNDWETLTDNWWTNEEHTIQAEFLPLSLDTVVTLGTVGPSVDLNTWNQADSIDASVTGITFTGETGMSVDIIGDVVFNGESYISSATITGDVVFNDSSRNSDEGTINGSAVLRDLSQNIGTINGDATFGDSSYNAGTVSGDATFSYASGGEITLSDSQVWGTVTGTAKGSDGIILTRFIFNDDSYNDGIVRGNATFNDDSYNTGEITGVPSLVTSPAVVVNKSTALLNGEITNTGNTIFNNDSYSEGTVSINATFNDDSVNDGGTVTGDGCFNDASVNDGTVNGDEICPVSTENVTVRGFNYGLTTAYGTTVTESAGPYGTGTYSANLEGLSCGTTYHFRSYATNDSGTSYGSDRTFETSPCPSSGSSPSRPRQTPPAETICPVGHLFSATTGRPCTKYEGTSNSNGPTLPNTCVIVNTLRLGSKGAEVVCLQKILKILADGMFGPQTKASVVSFQGLNGLVPDGVVGPKTRAVLLGL